MASREEKNALENLHRLVAAEDLSGMDNETLAEGVRAAELAFNRGDEWSGRFITELKGRLSWSELVALTGVSQTTLHRRWAANGEAAKGSR